MFFTGLFELIKYAAIPSMTMWYSHLITIASAVAISTIITAALAGKHLRLRKIAESMSNSSSDNIDSNDAIRQIPVPLILLAVMLGSMSLMTAYEMMKHIIWPDITIWQSHIITIVFSTVVATLCSVIIVRLFNRMYMRVVAAIGISMKSEKKYRENMLFLQQLMDDIPVAILYTDISGKLLGCNSAVERLTGINADNCIDMSIYEIIPPQIWDSADIPQTGQSTCTREMQYERKDSKKRCVVLYKSDYCDLHGEKRGYIGAVLDVTDRKALEDRLRLSEKLEAIGLLASGIAHDFNNNLMVIMGCANLLEHSVSEEEFTQCKNGIIRASRYSADLVKSLLDFAKLGQRKSLDVDIHSVIGEVVSALKPLIGERVAIMQLLEASDFIISGDPSQVFNALFNLSINSKDAIRETGTLNITTSDYSINDGNTMSFPELKPGKYIRINIADSGIGMTAETVKRIFEPFFTTKKFGEGTGMGLSIVYGTIRNHDGYIDVRSEINKGTVFEILLPVKA